MREMLVVKLGGSLTRGPALANCWRRSGRRSTGCGSVSRGPALARWLAALAALPGPVVIVPGGGQFADVVRAGQKILGYNDAAAHDMALMAMAQLARAVVALAPRIAYADTEPAIEAAIGQGRQAVFAAWPALRDAPELPRGWNVTSDSIAVVLACRLRAARLLVVKSAEPASSDPAEVAQAGLVDPAFPAMLRRYQGAAYISGPAVPAGGLDPLPGRRLQLRATETA